MASTPLVTAEHDRPEEGPRLDAGRLPLGEPKRLYRVLDAMLVSGAMGDDPEQLLARCLDELFEPLHQELGVEAAVLYAECERQFLVCHCVGRIPDALAPVLPADDPQMLALLESQTLVADEMARAGASPAAALAELMPCAATLVSAAGDRHLLLLLLSAPGGRAATSAVLNTLRTVLTARVLQDRWRRSLRTAAEIQRGLLPGSAPRLAGFEIAGRSLTAEEVGGDFFDFVGRPGGAVGVVVGDASGHGLPAALVARDAVVGLRVALDRETSVPDAFARLNRVLQSGVPFSSFVSAVHVEVRPDGRLACVNAGHPPPILVAPQGTAELELGGPVLGPWGDARYQERVSEIPHGAVLVLYSDGIVERRNSRADLLGTERLAQVVRTHMDAPAARIVEAVFALATSFGAHTPWGDDATLVIVKRWAHAGAER